MFKWIRFYVDLCLFRAAPQDAPTSTTVLYLTVFAYWTSGALLTSIGQGIIVAAIIALIQTILAMFFINLALWIRKFPERIVQTTTAFTGSGVLISLIALPIVLILGQGGEDTDILYSITWIALVVWETIIVAHIFRHALSIPLYAAAGVSLVLMYMSFAITLRILKLMSINLG
ncbi:MAG: hypothetical protein OEZ43_02730 [Gammaproteobacteria bacterium]|nr:hypothetical protein [Gammaproteobacteria bacterium]